LQLQNECVYRLRHRTPTGLCSLTPLGKRNQASKKEAGIIDGEVYISAKNGEGIDALKVILKERMGFKENNEDSFLARRRHLDALQRTNEFVKNAELQLVEYNAGELMAEELRQAQDELGTIKGRFTSDDLLGEIFSNFCIGK